MSRNDTSLCSLLRYEIEIVLNVGILGFYNIGVNQAASWRILQILATVLNKESLTDLFVHENSSEVWLLGNLIIEFINCLSKLIDLNFHHFLSH